MTMISYSPSFEMWEDDERGSKASFLSSQNKDSRYDDFIPIHLVMKSIYSSEVVNVPLPSFEVFDEEGDDMDFDNDIILEKDVFKAQDASSHVIEAVEDVQNDEEATNETYFDDVNMYKNIYYI